MALLQLESFDHITTGALALSDKWHAVYYTNTEPLISTSAGRSQNGLRLSKGAHAYMTIPDTQTLIVGFSFRPQELANKTICFFRDEETVQVSLTLGASGLIHVNRGHSTILATSTNPLQTGQFYYIEFKVTVSNTNGSFELRVKRSPDSVGTEATATLQDTQVSPNARINVFGLGGGTASDSSTNSFDYDDIYIADTSGTRNNNFLGPAGVNVIFPNGIGTITQWGGSYADVDETTPDDDSTYTILGGTSKATITYNYQDIRDLPGDIFGLAIRTYARKEYGNTAAIRNAFLSGTMDSRGGTVYVQTTPLYLETDYTYHSGDIYETNPAAIAAPGTWTPSAVNSGQWGHVGGAS